MSLKRDFMRSFVHVCCYYCFINKRNYTYNQKTYTSIHYAKKSGIHLLHNFSRLLAVTVYTRFTHMLRHAGNFHPAPVGPLESLRVCWWHLSGLAVWRFGGLFRGAGSPFRKHTPQCCIPTCSMYGICTYCCVVWGVNVGKYTIH